MLPIELQDEILRLLPPKTQIEWFHPYVDINQPLENIYRNAIINGDIKLVTLLFEYNLNCILIRYALGLAAKNGHLEIVKFLYSQHAIVCDFVIDAKYPPLNVTGIMLMLRTTPQDLMLMPDCTDNAIFAASKNKHRAIVDWIKANSQVSCVDRQYINEIIQKVLEKRDLKKQLN